MLDVSMKDALVRLIEYRTSMNLSQEALAELLGISRTQYSHMEKGRNALSYRVLSGLHSHEWDVDYIITGNHYSQQNNLLKKLLFGCAENKRKKLYLLLLTGFIEMWNWDCEKQMEQCLCSELRAMVVLLLNQADFNEKLLYIRQINGVSQQELAAYLGIGRTKCGKCEKGEQQLDAELMLLLYKMGYSLPSFYIDDYAGISEIEYLLNLYPEKKRKYYQYVGSVLKNIIEDEENLKLLQKSGVI